MKSLLKSICLIATALAVTVPALAQQRLQPGRPTPVDADVARLERSVQHLSDQLSSLNRRVRNLENLLDSRPVPQPQEVEYACLIIESLVSRSFLGKGRSQLDAEFQAKQNCSKTTSAQYCNNPATILKCSNNLNTRATGFVCIVSDSLVSRTFRGEGKTQVEAEANAKIACQNTTSAQYCGKVTPRCEETY